MLPNAISFSHLFLSVEDTSEHFSFIQSSLLFPQMSTDTHNEADSISPSNVTSSAESHQKPECIPSATRLLPPCTSFYFLPPKPLKFLLSARRPWIPASLCFPITLTNAAAPIPFPQIVLIGWSNQHPTASVRQARSMNIL
jgi:hypothetical protein